MVLCSLNINGLQVSVDYVDGWRLNKYRWTIVIKKGIPYVYRNDKNKTVYLAREIMDVTGSNIIVDHIDGNPLNNRRSNLRVADKRTNAQNMKSNIGTTSKFKGVCWDKARNKWRANIKIGDKQTHLGRFVTEKEAAIAYNNAAKQHYGEFARLNKV